MAKKVVIASACRTAIGKMGGALSNKHCRKMALLIVFPYGHGLDEMTGDVPDDVASLYCPWP